MLITFPDDSISPGEILPSAKLLNEVRGTGVYCCGYKVIYCSFVPSYQSQDRRFHYHHSSTHLSFTAVILSLSLSTPPLVVISSDEAYKISKSGLLIGKTKRVADTMSNKQ